MMGLPTFFAGGSTFSGVLAGALSQLEPTPGTIPAGFDAIMQCSVGLLQTNLAADLARRGLNPITLQVPYQPALVSPGLKAAIQPHVKPLDFVHGGVFLEYSCRVPRCKRCTGRRSRPVGERQRRGPRLGLRSGMIVRST